MLDKLIQKLNAEILKKFPNASKKALIRRGSKKALIRRGSK
jgi:hypothetical protein